MSDFLEDTNAARDQINGISMELNELGTAFNRTGNEALADKLWQFSYKLEESAKKIDDAVGAEIRDRCDQAQQASANMIAAALAMTVKDK